MPSPRKSRQQAERLAIRQAQQISTVARWKSAFAGTQPLPPVMLIERLEKQDPTDAEHLYLVQFARQRGSSKVVTGRVLLDGDTGESLSITGIEPVSVTGGRARPLQAYVTGATARRILRDKFGQQFARPIVEKPPLVWKPCQQSLSPELPFYRFSDGVRLYYVRVDGTPFADLTTPRPGA